MMGSHATFRNVLAIAEQLGVGWKSKELGRIQDIGLKLFKVDPAGMPSESHPDYAEGLLMIAGEITLELDGRPVPLNVLLDLRCLKIIDTLRPPIQLHSCKERMYV